MWLGTLRPQGRLARVRGEAADWALWAGAGARWSARFEGIPRLAALAVAVVQDAVDNARVCNKGDDAHACAADAEHWVYLENFPQQARPGAARFPGEVGIVLLGASVFRRSGAIAMGGGNGDSGPVGVGAVEALAMSSRIGNVGRNVLSCCNAFLAKKLEESVPHLCNTFILRQLEISR